MQCICTYIYIYIHTIVGTMCICWGWNVEANQPPTMLVGSWSNWRPATESSDVGIASFFAIWIETPLLGVHFSLAISPEVWICFTCFGGRLGPIALNLWQPRSPLVAGSLAAFIAGNSITAKLRCRKKTDTKMWPTATHLSQRWSVVLR